MQSNEEVVLGVIRAVEKGDAEALFELYHDDVELHDAPSLPYRDTARGKAEMRKQLETAPEKTWLGPWGPLQPTAEERRLDRESSQARVARSLSNTRRALSLPTASASNHP